MSDGTANAAGGIGIPARRDSMRCRTLLHSAGHSAVEKVPLAKSSSSKSILPLRGSASAMRRNSRFCDSFERSNRAVYAASLPSSAISRASGISASDAAEISSEKATRTDVNSSRSSSSSRSRSAPLISPIQRYCRIATTAHSTVSSVTEAQPDHRFISPRLTLTALRRHPAQRRLGIERELGTRDSEWGEPANQRNRDVHPGTVVEVKSHVGVRDRDAAARP